MTAEVQYRNRLFYEVKSDGYALTTFEPAANFKDNSVLDDWEESSASFRIPRSRQLPAGFRRDDEGKFQRMEEGG